MENTPVINCSSTWVSRLFSKEKLFSLIFITSLPRGVDSMALRTVLGETTALEWFWQKFVPYHSWWNQHPRRSQDKLSLGKYFEKLIFSMHSFATSFNSNLTQGSIIKMDKFLPKYANDDVYFKPVNSLWGYANSRMSKYMVRCLFNSNKLLRLLA